MATTDEALQELSEQEGLISTTDLAKKVGSTEGTLRKQMSTLKVKGYVDGSTKEGWVITPAGRQALERQEKIPITSKDVGTDTASKLRYYGSLVGITPDIILATVEMIMTGDPEDLTFVWDKMNEMDVPIAERRRWWSLWRNYLKQGIPPDMKDKIGDTREPSENEPAGDRRTPTKDGGRDYIIDGDIPIFIGSGRGDYSIGDAKDILTIRALRNRGAGTGGGGSQGWGPQDLLDLLDRYTPREGDGNKAKIYAVEQTEQGAILKEVEPGQPINLNLASGNKNQPMLIIDNQGVVQELKPGMRIGNPPATNNQVVPKITVVRQTDQGLVKEQHEPGDVIIVGGNTNNANTVGGVPFPVFDGQGKAVVDSQGRPVYANLESTMKILGWQADQKRAQERHETLMSLATTARENISDGISALREAAAELKKGSKTETTAVQIYECGKCHSQFQIPSGDWKNVICPNPECRTTYSREQVMS